MLHNYSVDDADFLFGRRALYTLPLANIAAHDQKTGYRPNPAPSEPNKSGTTIWVNLFTVNRNPSASPARPGGE